MRIHRQQVSGTISDMVKGEIVMNNVGLQTYLMWSSGGPQFLQA